MVTITNFMFCRPDHMTSVQRPFLDILGTQVTSRVPACAFSDTQSTKLHHLKKSATFGRADRMEFV